MANIQQSKRFRALPKRRLSGHAPRSTHHKLTSRCWKTGKLRYPDHAAAKDTLTAIAYQRAFSTREPGESRRGECRAYWCQHCHGWHLTSQPRNQGEDNGTPIGWEAA